VDEFAAAARKSEHFFPPQKKKRPVEKKKKRYAKTITNDTICARRANTNTHARDTREKQKKRTVPLGKSNAKSATCVFALVSLSFAIKMRPITQFENRTSTFGPISGHFFAPYFSHSLVVWSTCKMFFASSLTAINVAYGSGVCSSSSSSSSSVIFLSSSSSLACAFPEKN